MTKAKPKAADKPAASKPAPVAAKTAPAAPARRKMADDVVTVRIPHNFKLNVDGQIVDYGAGTDEMPLAHAEHQYSKDNGVEIVG